MWVVAGKICLVAVVMCLAGCDFNTFRGPAAISLDEEVLEIAVCRDLEVASLQVDLYRQGESLTLWEVEGALQLKREDTLRLPGENGDLEVGQRVSLALESGDRVTVCLSSRL